jgi:tetratricopeptide (TPR) repeat protein
MSRKSSRQKKKIRAKMARPRPLSAPQNMRLQAAVQAHAAGDFGRAERGYRALLREGARTPVLFGKLARICDETGRGKEAAQLWKEALKLDPADPDALLGQGRRLELAGDSGGAARCYRKILSRHPQLVVPRYLLANLQKSLGELEQARENYRFIHSRHPRYTQAHFSYSGVHRYRDREDPHLTQMLDVYGKNGLPEEGRIQLAFALGKAFEDLQAYDEAFRYLREGNELRYRRYQYSIDGDRDMFGNIMQVFSAQALAELQVAGNTSKKPIFIVGMPRSGTSLVEKILASHPDVHGAGELHDFYALASRAFLDPARHYRFNELSSYPADTFRELGDAYLARISALAADSPRVTDKLPLNMMMIGLIRLVLPNAKIIHCVRDARDTCLSIYKQNFATENYRFAYRLDTIAQFHKLYSRLMDHWRKVLPGVVYDVGYEALTHDPETGIRQLLEACELDWNDDCLAFSRSEGVVKTASAWQVRQPMYTSSVSLWEKYGASLKPLIDALEND